MLHSAHAADRLYVADVQFAGHDDRCQRFPNERLECVWHRLTSSEWVKLADVDSDIGGRRHTVSLPRRHR